MVSGGVERPGCTKICCDPEIRAKRDASLAREHTVIDGRVGSGRIGSGMAGGLLFGRLESLTDIKKNGEL